MEETEGLPADTKALVVIEGGALLPFFERMTPPGGVQGVRTVASECH